jgi:hypothetical protein
MQAYNVKGGLQNRQKQPFTPLFSCVFAETKPGRSQVKTTDSGLPQTLSYVLSTLKAELIRRPAIVVWITRGIARVRVILRIIVTRIVVGWIGRIVAGIVAGWNEKRLASIDTVRVRKTISAGDSVGINSVQTPN